MQPSFDRHSSGLWLPSEKPSYPCRLIEDHPFAHLMARCWPVNESAGNQIYDLTGNSRPAVKTISATGTIGWDAGVAGQCLNYGTADDVMGMVTPDSFVAGNADDWAIAYRFLLPLDFRDVLIGEYGTSNNYVYVRPSTRIRFKQEAIYDFGAYGTLGQVIDVVFNIHGSTDYIEIYTDGLFHDDRAASTDTDMTINTIGGAYSSAYFCFRGLIWYVYIWNRALSASEIAHLHAEPYCMIEPVRPRTWFFVPAGGTIQFDTSITVQSNAGLADLSVLRGLVSAIAAASDVGLADLAVQRPLGAAIAAGSDMTAADLQVLRALVASLSASTDTAAVDLAIQRLLSSVIAAATESSDTDLDVVRILAAAIQAGSLTSDIDLRTALEFAAQIIASSDAAAVDLAVRRLLDSDVAAMTATTDAAMSVLRALAAQAAAIAATSDIDLVTALMSVINTTIESLTPRRSITSVTPELTITAVTPRRTIEPA